MLCSVLLVDTVKGQVFSENTALHNIGKLKWDKARSQLSKLVRKDSVNAGALYVWSLYFFSRNNPAYHIDSAYRYVMEAARMYPVATDRQRERWRRLPLDSAVLVYQRERIDSAGFEQARQRNTEAAYIQFLEKFPLASQGDLAVELRNEVAYLDALKENTYTSFRSYLEKYPKSARAEEARSRYEKLLFESKTRDKKLASFESFLKEFPQSPYRPPAEQQIFEIMTAAGTRDSFEKFLSGYPKCKAAKIGRNLLYHILREEDRPVPATLMTDSIRAVEELQRYYLIPLLKDGKFGLINEMGKEVVNAVADEIPDEYLCGDIRDEALVMDGSVIGRNGIIIYKGDVEGIDPLGYGYYRVTESSCVKLIHVAGLVIGGQMCSEDAKLIGKNFIALKDKRWSLWTFTGRMLMGFDWDDIQSAGNVVIFKKGGRYKLATVSGVAQIANQSLPEFTSDFDDFTVWPDDRIWVKRGSEQAVLNQRLGEWVPFKSQEMTLTFFGALSKTKEGYNLYTSHGSSNRVFTNVKVSKPWVAVQDKADWRLIDPVSKQYLGTPADSVYFIGPFCVTSNMDTVRVHLNPSQHVEVLASQKIRFLPGKDSLAFLVVEEAEKKTVYSVNGEKLFTVVADHLEYNNEHFFVVTKKDKRGIISITGKSILPPEYDALGTVNGGMVTTLKDKKFGFADLVHQRIIKPEYDKNITSYNARHLIAFKSTGYGIVGWDGKPITPFEFDEIRYWNDSTALMKRNFNWLLYNFIEKKIILGNIKRFKWVNDSVEERVLIVQQENGYGVISSRRGTVIPPTFSDIINLGTASTPLYFTEKHVEEASIYVVIYYDKNGAQLKRQVFEPDDYERIYCSQ